MLLGGIVLISSCSIVVCALKYFVLQDYIIQVAVECDPTTESCFVSVCDPGNEECTGDSEQDTEYYKIIERSASGLPACLSSDEECREIPCEADQGCFEILCDESTADEFGDRCSQPEDSKEMVPEDDQEDSVSIDREESPVIGE